MMRIVDRPLHPAACVVCGNAQYGPFLDTALYNVFDVKRTRVYLCNQHFLEVLRVEKLVPIAELEQQVARLGDALGQVASLEEQARLDAARIAELTSENTDQADVIAGRDVQIELLKRRLDEASVDPALAEHQRLVAEVTKAGTRQRRRVARAS